MPEDNSTAVSEESTTQKSLLKRLFGLYEIILIALISLSIIGIGITDYSPANSRRYWFLMVPVFAGACLILEWSRARGKGQKWTTIVRTQMLLQLGLLLAVRPVYLLLHTGRLDNTGIRCKLTLVRQFPSINGLFAQSRRQSAPLLVRRSKLRLRTSA